MSVQKVKEYLKSFGKDMAVLEFTVSSATVELAASDVSVLTGHEIGGVCPFANPEYVTTYLDVSMQRFDTVFPAAGSSSSAIELSCQELFDLSGSKGWIDVCRPSGV